MTELKSCPFCGEKPVMHKARFYGYYYVICENVNCLMNVETSQMDDEESAAHAWNTRYSDSDQ